MFDMDKKPWLEKPSCDFPHDKPPFDGVPPCKPYTPFEKAEETIREMRATIDRLLKFEKWLKDTHDSMVKEITRDNVIFKETYAEEYRLFLEQVKTEVNQFESDVTNKWKLFETTVLADYKNLSADTARQIEENYLTMRKSLSETLTRILEEMKANGEFADVMENTLLPDIADKLNKTRQDFYIVNADNVAEAVSACKSDNKIFYVPYGVKLTISDTLDLRGMDVAVYGEISITHNGIGVIVGELSSSVERRTIHIAKVTHTNYNANDVSVRVMGVMNANVVIGRADFVQLYANGDSSYPSIAYSNFHIGKCEYLQIMDEVNSSKIGWINENTFYNVRVMTELSIIGNTYEHNNNVFYKPCIEGAKLTLKKCRRNKFYDVRNEGFVAELDENTKENAIYLNFFWDSPFIETADSTTVTDNGFSNIITNHVLKDLSIYPLYALTGATITKGTYEIVEPTKFTVGEDGETISTQAWAKIIDTVIPVDGIKHLVMKSDRWMVRMYATPLDSDGNPVMGGLNFPAHTQNSNGQYDAGNHITNGYISIVDKRVKKLQLSIKTSSTVNTFTSMCLMAYYDPRDFAKVMAVAETFKA